MNANSQRQGLRGGELGFTAGSDIRQLTGLSRRPVRDGAILQYQIARACGKPSQRAGAGSAAAAPNNLAPLASARSELWFIRDGFARPEKNTAVMHFPWPREFSLPKLGNGRPRHLSYRHGRGGVDQAPQEALIAYLRRRGLRGRPLFLLTRSCAMLDLGAGGADESIIRCPANHHPPTRVGTYLGAPGYEAAATRLAAPEVRARTEVVIAWRWRDGLNALRRA